MASLIRHKLLLVNPPFTQLNTPYPATAYLKGYLNTKQIPCDQVDLGLETILKIFSTEGLSEIFKTTKESVASASENAKRIFALKDIYIQTIDSVIAFLQDRDPSMAYFISGRNFIPEASKFDQLDDLEFAFGTMGMRDKARHLATLYLEDLSDYIVELSDPHFGFSRYAERLALSANSFDALYDELRKKESTISSLMLSLLKDKIEDSQPTIICFSIPFPGNLFAALKCGQWIRTHYPETKIVFGGGYPNTELRSLKDPRVFEFVDFICLDDGEAPLDVLIDFLSERIPIDMLKRTYTLQDNKVRYHNGSLRPDVRQENVGTPDYTGLPLKQYLSVIQVTNPMHRLWSDGRWNKLTMAHGCYWGKCTFCDVSLDYIKNYEASSAALIVDRMEALVQQTGETGFHFVDEAAPPALMKAVALEIMSRNLNVSWWTNIRFEKSFHYDLCRLLSASGCIAISGGLEVASDRLLELIAKGVTVEQVTRVNQNFKRAGIMVHAYLMYGFPTQTDQETIDSLEVVRQMFEADVLQSAYWHRFAMTAHSPVGLYPDQFKVAVVHAHEGDFANNDLAHEDPTGADHGRYQHGLAKSLYNFMHGIGFDFPLQEWFDHPVPDTTLNPELISGYLAKPQGRDMKDQHQVVWVGASTSYDTDAGVLTVFTKKDVFHLTCQHAEGIWLERLLQKTKPQENTLMTFKQLRADYDRTVQGDFTLFWYGQLAEKLKEIGWLVL